MSSLDTIRNIAFVGHPSAGKTTLVDALAHLTGASARKGSVADKSSICDTEPEEQEKQHTLQLSSVAANWGDRKWTFLDTPGYPEFLGEVQSAMFGADLVIGVVSCASGPTFNLRTKMKVAAQLGRGRAIVLTHLDGENADFDIIVADLRERIGEICVPVRLPNGNGASFTDVTRTIADPESEWCTRLKDRVMDACSDEQLLMEYMDNGELTEEQLEEHMPGAIAAGALVPILVCNPESGVGVESTLNYLKRFAPSPDNLPLKDTDGEEIDHSPDGAFAGTVINVKTDPHVGRVCLVRIHRGTLTPADAVHGPGAGKPEKLGGLFQLVGRKREPVDSAGPGEIVAFSKVEHLSVWDHFTSESGDPVAT
ncbi:MAG: elongation factor G, partial [Planctomycetota bacterium]